MSDYGPLLDNVVTYTAEVGKDADRRLVQLRAGLREKGVASETVRMAGIATTAIVELGKKRNVDYIVIGSHGHTAFYDLLVGSTTAGVLKRAHCPVVVVPPQKKTPRKARR